VNDERAPFLISARLETELREPDRDLKIEDFSAKPEDADREPYRALARPLVSEPARDNEPDSDLKNEDFSARLETEPREPDRDLNSELFSTKPETKPSEPDRDLARPLT
jgi:hypothetical protein